MKEKSFRRCVSIDVNTNRKTIILLYYQKTVSVDEVGQTSAVTDEDDDEESHFSEGQVITVGSQSVSDDSEISEELEVPEDGRSY